MVSTNFLTGTCQELQKLVEGFIALMCIVAVYERTSVVEVIRRTVNARVSSFCCMLVHACTEILPSK